MIEQKSRINYHFKLIGPPGFVITVRTRPGQIYKSYIQRKFLEAYSWKAIHVNSIKGLTTSNSGQIHIIFLENVVLEQCATLNQTKQKANVNVGLCVVISPPGLFHDMLGSPGALCCSTMPC